MKGLFWTFTAMESCCSQKTAPFPYLKRYALESSSVIYISGSKKHRVPSRVDALPLKRIRRLLTKRLKDNNNHGIPAPRFDLPLLAKQ